MTRDFDKKVLPENELKTVDAKVFNVEVKPSEEMKVDKWIDEILKYSRSLITVQKIIARFIRVFYKGSSLKCIKDESADLPKSKNNILMKAAKPNINNILSMNVSPEELFSAERLLLKLAMIPTVAAMKKGQLDSLLPMIEGDMVVTQGRLGEQKMLELFGVRSLPILMPKTRLAYLYMVNAHHGEYGLVHRGVVSTLARSRCKVWIVRGNRLSRKVCEECLVCRREAKKLVGQQMSLIREQQLQIAPPFTHICLDFAGPVKVSDQVSRRKFMKVWILVYSCVATKAVVLLATPGYSTQDFLCKHDEFTARYGQPRTIVSDKGSQLVKSSVKVEEKDMPVNSFNWNQVTSKNFKTKWIFVTAGGQHRNGLAESTVKVMKKSLNHALHAGQVLSYAELVTLLARIATSVNRRLLSIGRTSSSSEQNESLLPITPNHLLLGRTTSEPINLEYQEEDKFSRRLAFIQSIHDAWWKSWINEVLPTLIPCKKWKYPKKNLNVNDIVMVHYKGNMTDDYRIAKVTEVFPDVKNLVRTVKIAFRKKDKREAPEMFKSKPLTEDIVHVQKLSLLQAADEPVWDGEFNVVPVEVL